jgi:hypothetical protein
VSKQSRVCSSPLARARAAVGRECVGIAVTVLHSLVELDRSVLLN